MTGYLHRRHLLTSGAALTLLSACGRKPQPKAAIELLNVSYDPTREFYEAYNALFAKLWLERAGQVVTVRQSHGGSGKQARAVADGLEADVVTLALADDIDVLARRGLVSANWAARLPDHAAPYTSIIVFLVRKGNPKGIRDWGDLVRPGVEIVTPNPKTGGGARWNYLAAYSWALKANGGNESAAEAYIRDLYAHVPVLDAGARGSTTTFIQRGIGDVLLTWENEAFLALRELAASGDYEIVTPPTSIRAEPPVAWVDAVTDRRGTTAVAKAYLEHLYSPEAQTLIGEYGYRPSDPAVAVRFAGRFAAVSLSRIDDLGGWSVVQPKHFDAGGVFDRITRK
ncbi:MAG: sulfate ABC transporter substrate-binding protein [Asticcacaulis sp.]